METQTNSSKVPNPDAAIMNGGPADPLPRDGEVHPELIETKEVVKYELNGKTFSSAEEMSKYVADLEKKVIDAPQTVQQAITVPQTNNKVIIDGMTLDQLMFANPERYSRYLEEQAERKLDQKLQMIETRKQFWSDFYTNNPDLRGREEIVDALVAKNWSTWEKMPVKEFAKVVSDTSRTTLKKVGAFNATEVKQTASAALSATGEGAPKIETPRKETNFVEELKVRQLNRRNAKVR